jgi:acyl-CoA synthetase (NDP forming)
VDQLGTAAVLKVVSPQVVHKTDVGGVETGVASAAHATAAWARMIDRVKAAVPDAQIRGVLVQPQIPSGRELILGIVRDPLFGPLVMFGLGGVYVETLRDVIFRIAPLTRGDARDMIRGIKGARILEGVRGQPPVQFAQLEDVLLRLSALATDFPQIAELDVNPLVAFPESLVAVDCRVQLTAGPDAAH